MQIYIYIHTYGIYLYLVHLQQLQVDRSLATDPFPRISHLLKGHRACGTLGQKQLPAEGRLEITPKTWI